MPLTIFQERVYSLLKKVPAGYVTTYKELAKQLNSKAYRAVGFAMKRNPYAPIVPCHRVVKSDGSIGGFIGESEGEKILKKIGLLEKEGINVKDNKIMDFERKKFKFDKSENKQKR